MTITRQTVTRRSRPAPAPTPTSVPTPTPRVKWEYDTTYLPVHTPEVAAVLNAVGADGWEAWHVEAGVAYLKRIVMEVGDAAKA